MEYSHISSEGTPFGDIPPMLYSPPPFAPAEPAGIANDDRLSMIGDGDDCDVA